VKINVGNAFVILYFVSVVALGVAGCGGAPSGSISGAGGGPSGPSAGEYLWEFSLTNDNLFFSTVDSGTGQLGAPTMSQGIACNSLGTIPSIAVTPSRKFAFVIDNCLAGIHVYSMNGPGISLAEIVGSPYFSPTALDSISVDPSGKFLYAIGSPGTVYQFAVNGNTGELSLLSTTVEAADLRQVVADPNGKFIFVNDLTGGRVFGFLVGGGASLSPVPGSPFIVPANGQPVNLVMEGGGTFLYSPLISGGIAGFAINTSTGALSDMPGSPFPTSGQPFTLATDPSWKFLYSIGGSLNSSIEGFSIDANTGTLAAITGSPFSTPSSLNSLAVDPSGHFLYATVQAMTLADSNILGFAINTSNGSLSELATSPYSAPPFPVNVVSLHIP